jgi:electron transfer flavoprotein alpha subunit
VRIAALVKQIPRFEEMELGADGRLVRDGIELELNAYCRRAVSKACELAAERPGSSVTVITLGAPAAEDALRESIAWGLERSVEIDGVLVTDAAFAGSDTLATASALAAAIRREGDFDLVLVGRNSLDADTGQVGPELAELLDLPFMTGVRHLSLDGDDLQVRCEHDDGWLQAELRLPAVLSCAERLCEPAKVDPEGRAAVPANRIRSVHASDLGAGPWGQEASPTWVGEVRVLAATRTLVCRPDAPLDEQVRLAVAELRERGALHTASDVADEHAPVPAGGRTTGPVIAVVVEPDRAHLTAELLASAALLADAIDGRVVAVTVDEPLPAVFGGWGADEIVVLNGAHLEEDVATGLASWITQIAPWAVIVGSTAWGREVASRAAARVGAGLTGDAIGLEVADGRMVAWKPAFGGQLVAAITATSPVQMATVRAGMLPHLAPRAFTAAVTTRAVEARGRIRLLARTRDDDLDTLAEARAVVAIGVGIDPADYPMLDPLLGVLGAELGATRKVTDQGWLPRARQIGITGRSVAPRLLVSIGASGKFNHTIGLRAARTVLCINSTADALIFGASDIGIVGDYREVVPLLVAELTAAATPTTSALGPVDARTSPTALPSRPRR